MREMSIVQMIKKLSTTGTNYPGRRGGGDSGEVD